MNNPEQYWIDRGADLIGKEILTEGENARQAPTYAAIAEEIILRGIKSVVDVGCNVAALLEFLERRGYTGTYLGIDSNPHAVANLWERGIQSREGNLRSLDLMDYGPVSCVVLKDVLEHLESPEPLGEAFKINAEYVIVSFFMPPKESAANIFRTVQGYYHNHYCEADILDIAERFGYEMNMRIDTQERTGDANRTYVFLST
jgi:SAM-dependent methyltransferase